MQSKYAFGARLDIVCGIALGEIFKGRFEVSELPLGFRLAQVMVENALYKEKCIFLNVYHLCSYLETS